MAVFLTILEWTILSISIIYFVLILWFLMGWLKLGKQPPLVRRKHFSTQVTIVLPVRNESAQIGNCIQQLLAQDYPKHLYEIIVVNDHSEDNTLAQAKTYANTLLKVLDLKEEQGKKAALNHGITQAKGALIVTTDADCVMDENWLSHLVGYYEQYRPKLITMPVLYKENNTLFGQIQSLEFLSLIGISLAAVENKTAMLCNGANLAFEKEAFMAVGGYANNNNIASGDDVFLLHKMKKQFPNEIKALRHKEVAVYTHPQPTLKSFMEQRVRWGGKAKHYRDGFTIITSAIVLTFNLCLFIGLLFYPFYLKIGMALLVSFSLKCIIDFLFLFLVASYYGKSRLLSLFLVEELLYTFYVILVALKGLLTTNRWKGRIIG